MKVYHVNCTSEPHPPEIGSKMKRLNANHCFCPTCHVEVELNKTIPTYPPGDGVFFSWENPLTGKFVQIAVER